MQRPSAWIKARSFGTGKDTGQSGTGGVRLTHAFCTGGMAWARAAGTCSQRGTQAWRHGCVKHRGRQADTMYQPGDCSFTRQLHCQSTITISDEDGLEHLPRHGLLMGHRALHRLQNAGYMAPGCAIGPRCVGAQKPKPDCRTGRKLGTASLGVSVHSGSRERA